MATLEKKDITERVVSFETACKELGIKMGFVFKIITTCALLNRDVKAYLAFVKLTIIIRALNEGWEPNWENYNEDKWYCWFKVSGSRLSSAIAMTRSRMRASGLALFLRNHGWPIMLVKNSCSCMKIIF